MTYKEARDKLHELAGNKYCSIAYRTQKHEGRITNTCCLYVEDGTGTAEAATWELAFDLLAINRGVMSIPSNQEPITGDIAS